MVSESQKFNNVCLNFSHDAIGEVTYRRGGQDNM